MLLVHQRNKLHDGVEHAEPREALACSSCCFEPLDSFEGDGWLRRAMSGCAPRNSSLWCTLATCRALHLPRFSPLVRGAHVAARKNRAKLRQFEVQGGGGARNCGPSQKQTRMRVPIFAAVCITPLSLVVGLRARTSAACVTRRRQHRYDRRCRSRRISARFRR